MSLETLQYEAEDDPLADDNLIYYKFSKINEVGYGPQIGNSLGKCKVAMVMASRCSEARLFRYVATRDFARSGVRTRVRIFQSRVIR